MTKHAPGPWAIREGHAYIAIRSGAGVWADVRIAGGITEQDRANARLIAAAPDMAQALRDLLALHIAHHNHPHHGRAREILRAIDGE